MEMEMNFRSGPVQGEFILCLFQLLKSEVVADRGNRCG